MNFMEDLQEERQYDKEEYQLGETAYRGYCQSTGGVSIISGDKLPEWSDLRIEIQDAWTNAALEVKEYCL